MTIKSLVNKVNWEQTLNTWSKLIMFKGILFPLKDTSSFQYSDTSNEENSLQNNDISNKENSAQLDKYENEEKRHIVKTNEMQSDSLPHKMCEGMLRLSLTDIDNSAKDSDLNICCPKRTKPLRISESSDDMYFSAEEENYPSVLTQSIKLEKKEDISNEAMFKPDDNILKFRATCNRVGDHSFTSMEAAAVFGGTLNDKFNWIVDLTKYDLNVILNINKDNVYVCSGITERSLHRRNITHFGYVTLRSTMCYNLVRLAEPVKGEIIIDPLCGGGSIPIEGAIGFPNTFHICGDNNDKAINRTWANVNHLKKSEQNLMVDPIKWTARKLPLRDASIDVCVTDLPFGKRSGRKSDNLPLYTSVLSEMARVCRCGTSRAVLLTHDKKSLTKALSGPNGFYWRQIRTTTVNQGGLFSTVYLLLRTAKPFLV